MYSVIEYFNGVEGGICLSINRLSRRAWIRRFFAVVSRLGDGGFWVAMAVVLVALQGLEALPLVLRMLITGSSRHRPLQVHEKPTNSAQTLHKPQRNSVRYRAA